MRLGYNTNGLAHHDPFAAVELLAEIGYQSAALSIDHGPFSPHAPDALRQLARLKRLLDRLGMRSVVETGARFLLDPRLKHEPTLMSSPAAARERRLEFLRFAVDAAGTLESDCVSLWSGVLREPIDQEAAFERLTAGLEQVLDYAAGQGVAVGFEPEPGMFIDSMDRHAELRQRLDGRALLLTLDLGHLHCMGETPIADQVRRWAPQLVNVHIEDMRAGVHEHLMFGEGEIDFPPVLAALAEIGYQGGLHVELSRHSHEGPDAARRAYEFLQPQLDRLRGA